MPIFENLKETKIMVLAINKLELSAWLKKYIPISKYFTIKNATHNKFNPISKKTCTFPRLQTAQMWHA